MVFSENESYDGYDIRALVSAGVNIINVDMTIHDNGFFQKIKNDIDFFEKIPDNVSSVYIPIALSVTMSANNPIDFDERVSK